MPRRSLRISLMKAPVESRNVTPVARAKPKAKRRAENGSEVNPEAVAPPVKSARTALTKSKQAAAVSSGVKQPAKVPKSKGVARTASVRAKKEVPVEVIESSLISEEPASATVYCFGTNDCGQLGFECGKRKYPALVPELNDNKIKAVACGGMHTLVLEENGKVWSFGLNDDKALGRHTEDEEESFVPGLVSLPTKVKQISAGDSHSAALTEDGKVFAWGCFKDGNGNYGLVADDGDVCREKPEDITADIGVKIVKIASGAHHIAMLSEDGLLYTCGAGEQGQLGRVDSLFPEILTRSKGMISRHPMPRSYKEHILKPAAVFVGFNVEVTDIWTGEFSTYCSSKKKDIYVCGLNNYSQLGIRQRNVKDVCVTDVIEKPTKKTTFVGKNWKQIAAGQHHVVALDENGFVYTLGRAAYGQLGLGEINAELDRYSEPTVVQGLADKRCVQVATGGSTSYAITNEGHLYSWGFGENYQLATGDDDDRNFPFRCRESPNTDIQGIVKLVDAGGLHVALTISRSNLANVGPKINGKA